jgi:hypothetical protein
LALGIDLTVFHCASIGQVYTDISSQKIAKICIRNLLRNFST